MCTLALIRRRVEGFPLVVAANRDEAVDRPATGPQRWDDPVPFVAGRDESAGGTWLGVNAHGLVVGLTNHWTGDPPDSSRASRGEVVRSLLACRDVAEVAANLRTRDPHATNPFLLLAAQREGEAGWTGSALGLEWTPIRSDVFALGNRPPGDDDTGRVRTLEAAMRDVVGSPAPAPGDLVRCLADHLASHRGDRGPLESVCVHTDRGYGTVSATIVLLGDAPSDDELHHAPGPPCTTPMESHAALLRGVTEGRRA